MIRALREEVKVSGGSEEELDLTGLFIEEEERGAVILFSSH